MGRLHGLQGSWAIRCRHSLLFLDNLCAEWRCLPGCLPCRSLEWITSCRPEEPAAVCHSRLCRFYLCLPLPHQSLLFQDTHGT